MVKTIRTYKYRLYPNRKQCETMLATLEICRQLYNDALQERRDAWKQCRRSVTFKMQSAQLPACKQYDASLGSVYSQVLQDVLRRVEKAYKAVFTLRYGVPHFKSKTLFDSFTYPQHGFYLDNARLCMSKIGSVKIKLHRPLGGQIKTLTLKREAGNWYACLSCIVNAPVRSKSNNAVGIDVGLESFAVTSDAEIIDNPRWYRAAQKKLRAKQRHMSRCHKRSRGWKRACSAVTKIHCHVFNQRSDSSINCHGGLLTNTIS